MKLFQASTVSAVRDADLIGVAPQSVFASVLRSLAPLQPAFPRLPVPSVLSELNRTAERWRELARDPLEKLREGLDSYARLQSAAVGIGSQIQTTLAALQPVGQIAALLQAQQAPALLHFTSVAEPLARYHRETLGITAALQAASQPWMDLLRRLPTLPRLPALPELEPLLRFLVARSWYPSTDLPVSLLFSLDELLDTGDGAEVDARLEAYFHARLDRIEATLVAAHPTRSQHFTEAFRAHRLGLYTVCIPAFLTLADALGHALWQSPFFSGKCAAKAKAALDQTVAAGADYPSADEPWLLPLFENGSLRVDTRTLTPNNAILNRHAVVHGIRADWHTEQNSLKCVSLLDYLHSLTGYFAFAQSSLPTVSH